MPRRRWAPEHEHFSPLWPRFSVKTTRRHDQRPVFRVPNNAASGIFQLVTVLIEKIVAVFGAIRENPKK